jgi:disulfide bond formation protein DsbB
MALTVGCGEKAPAVDPAVVAAGQQHFGATCATCHGKDANGLPKQGKSLLMNPWIMDKTDAELVAFLKTGRRTTDPLNTTGVDMPPKGGNPAFTDADLAAIVAYLRTLQKLP